MFFVDDIIEFEQLIGFSVPLLMCIKEIFARSLIYCDLFHRVCLLSILICYQWSGKMWYPAKLIYCMCHFFWIWGIAPTGCGVWTTCPRLLLESAVVRDQTPDLAVIGSDTLTTRLPSHIWFNCTWLDPKMSNCIMGVTFCFSSTSRKLCGGWLIDSCICDDNDDTQGWINYVLNSHIPPG